jgi:hypothetical protein
VAEEESVNGRKKGRERERGGREGRRDPDSKGDFAGRKQEPERISERGA